MISRQCRWNAACIAAMVCVAGAQLAFAQFGRGPGGAGGGLIGLSTHPEVQAELKLDDATTEKVNDLAGDFGEEMQSESEKAGLGFGEFQKLQELEPAKRQERMNELREKIMVLGRKQEAKFIPRLKEILSQEQFTRLQQIRWQAGGSLALEDADLVKALELSKEQQEKISALNKETAGKQAALFSAAFQEGGGGNPREMMKKVQDLTKERDEKSVALLKDDQKKKYEELKGPPFDVRKLLPPGLGG